MPLNLQLIPAYNKFFKYSTYNVQGYIKTPIL